MNNSKLTPKVQKNLMLVVSCLWLLSTVAWIITIVLDAIHQAAVLQLGLHVFCAILSAVCAVTNFFRWRKMPGEAMPSEDTLDSENK